MIAQKRGADEAIRYKWHGPCAKMVNRRFISENDIWFDEVMLSEDVMFMDEVLAIYRDRENSLSSRKMDMLKYNYQIYRQVEKFSPIVSVFFLFFVFLPYYLYKKSSRYLYQYHDIDKAVFGDIAKLIKKNLTTEEGYKLQRETMFLDIPYSKMILTLQS